MNERTHSGSARHEHLKTYNIYLSLKLLDEKFSGLEYRIWLASKYNCETLVPSQAHFYSNTWKIYFPTSNLCELESFQEFHKLVGKITVTYYCTILFIYNKGLGVKCA